MTSYKAVKVFESHTKHDSDFCDVFDKACARVGIDAFRSEYESIESPAWKTIKDELSQSSALFLLIGKALVSMQSAHEKDWEYTQNWISYEIGIASALNIDIWVACDSGIHLNFPVPYFNNYLPYGISSEGNFKCMVSVLREYSKGNTYDTLGIYKITCPYSECKLTYNLHAEVKEGGDIICPCCLKVMTFKKGFP